MSKKKYKDNPRKAQSGRRERVRKWVIANQDYCGICGKAVDKSLHYLNPMAPEVDEIIPVSLGGSPYDKANLQLSHRICNQRKSNKIVTKNPRSKHIPTSTDW